MYHDGELVSFRVFEVVGVVSRVWRVCVCSKPLKLRPGGMPCRARVEACGHCWKLGANHRRPHQL